MSYPADEEFARINSAVLAGEAEVVYTHELGDAERARAVRQSDALLAWKLFDEVPAAALGESQRLRLIQLLSAGVDAVDFSAVPDSLIVASNAGAYAAAMSEHVLAMTLSLAKRLPQRHAAMAAGRFDKWEPSLVLDGRLMRALGARIWAVNRSGVTTEAVDYVTTLAELDLVLAAADVLLISLPLTLATRGLIGRRELALMKPTAIVVNVARAAIVGQGALYEHLRTHPEFSAAIDTWWTEPSGDSPFITDYPFFDLPNVLGSPHNSSIVPGTMLTGARLAAENVRRYLRGEAITGVVGRADYVAAGG